MHRYGADTMNMNVTTDTRNRLNNLSKYSIEQKNELERCIKQLEDKNIPEEALNELAVIHTEATKNKYISPSYKQEWEKFTDKLIESLSKHANQYESKKEIPKANKYLLLVANIEAAFARSHYKRDTPERIQHLENALSFYERAKSHTPQDKIQATGIMLELAQYYQEQLTQNKQPQELPKIKEKSRELLETAFRTGDLTALGFMEVNHWFNDLLPQNGKLKRELFSQLIDGYFADNEAQRKICKKALARVYDSPDGSSDLNLSINNFKNIAAKIEGIKPNITVPKYSKNEIAQEIHEMMLLGKHTKDEFIKTREEKAQKGDITAYNEIGDYCVRQNSPQLAFSYYQQAIEQGNFINLAQLIKIAKENKINTSAIEASINLLVKSDKVNDASDLYSAAKSKNQDLSSPFLLTASQLLSTIEANKDISYKNEMLCHFINEALDPKSKENYSPNVLLKWCRQLNCNHQAMTRTEKETLSTTLEQLSKATESPRSSRSSSPNFFKPGPKETPTIETQLHQLADELLKKVDKVVIASAPAKKD